MALVTGDAACSMTEGKRGVQHDDSCSVKMNKSCAVNLQNNSVFVASSDIKTLVFRAIRMIYTNNVVRLW
jgi:hypothetical protein